jgi:hypothetical protein
VRKRLWLAVSWLVIMILMVSGCAAPSVEPSEPAGESPVVYYLTPGRYFWPKPDWALDEPSFGEVTADNPESLRLLTDEEKDRVVEIALETTEASAWREKEPEYRAELIWYTRQDPAAKDSRMLSFGYYRALYEIYSELYWRPGSLSKTAVWYPGVRIGFGKPKQFVIEVAVDLETGEVLYANGYADVNRKSDLQWLTEEEKNTVIEIALDTAEANGWLGNEDKYRVGLSWKAIWDGGYRVFPYEVVEEGFPSYVPAEEAEFIYPNVTIWPGEPAETVISIAVDLDRKEVVYDESYPNLSHPDRFKQ